MDINMETIKDRLAHILRAKNLTASQFAEMMEIQPSNVSHLLNGRNNPSLDFLIKLKEIFPEYSFDWIILGKKPITINDPSPVEHVEEENIVEFEDLDQNINENTVINNNITVNQPNVGVKKMIVVYDDNTFEVITPR